MSGELTGKVAVVTGGGSGIGRAIASGLAVAGADVAVVGRQSDLLDSAVAEIVAHGRRGLAVPYDLREHAGIPGVLKRVCDELEGLDILVNSAGVQLTGPSLEFPVADFEATFATNVTALFACCQTAGRHFTAQGSGKIVNIGSTFSVVGFPQFAAYCASKGAVHQLTRALAAEWAPLGVNVNAIGPTAVRTDLNAYLLDSPEFLDFFLPKVPAGRIGQVGDVVGAAVFLSSPAADFIHGHLLLVDGGYTAV